MRPKCHSSKVESYFLIRATKLDDIGINRELLQRGVDFSQGYQKISHGLPLVLAVGKFHADLVALLHKYVDNVP